MNPCITVKGLGVQFVVRKKAKMMFARREKTQVNALSDVNFSVEQGEFLGYIGPNGAGKSTTIKCLSGILTPTQGEIRVLGLVPHTQRVRHVASIGVVFGQRTQLWWDLPVIYSYQLLKDIYRIPTLQYKKTLEELAWALDIEPLLRVPVRQLSLGQRMRCDLAASLLHSPPIVFLDEPTIGLDAISKLNMRSFVKKLNKENGATILLTTHDMEDVQSLCQRILLIGKGRLLLDGTADTLRARAGALRRISAQVIRPDAQLHLPKGAHLVRDVGNGILIEFDPNLVVAEKIIALLASEMGIVDMRVGEVSLEETVAQLYRSLAEVKG